MPLVVAIVAAVIGAAFCFGGFKFFLILLPLWGFLVGFNVGMDAVTAIFERRDVRHRPRAGSSGFVLALLFAVFSYLWYWLAIALLGGSIGYIFGSSVWGLIGNEHGLVAFAIGLVCAVALAIVVLALNVPKMVVIILTGLGGAATILTAWFIVSGAIPVDDIHWTTVGREITKNWFWLIVWGVLGAAGIIAQLRASTIGPDTWELDKSSYRYA